MYPRDVEPLPALFEHLLAEFNASDQQFEQNMHVIARRDGQRPRRNSYLGVKVHTARSTFAGRVFDLPRDGKSISLCTARIESQDQFAPADAVFISMSAVEAIEITESFALTFEVGIRRENLHEILNSFHASATTHDGETDARAGVAIKRAVDAWSGTNSGLRNANFDVAERRWRDFCFRAATELGVEQRSPGWRENWYRSSIEADTDGHHFGEVAFRHMHHNMPSDYLYPDTRAAVEQAYRTFIIPTNDPWAQ